MACFLISKSIVSSNFPLKNKYIPLLLTNSRKFCSKDSDGKTESPVSEDSSSKEKQDKKPKETPIKVQGKQFKPAPVITHEMKEAAKQKLMSLLSGIEVASENSVKSSNLNLAKPVKRISKKERLKQMEDEKITPEKELDMAVKAVAGTFKEDSEKVEMELTEKLTTLKLTKDATSEQVVTTQDISPLDKLNRNLMPSVEEVASTISESPIPPRSELTKRLMRVALDQKVTSGEKKSVRSVIEGMVVQPSKKHPVTRRRQTAVEEQEQETIERRTPGKRLPMPRRIENINLFGGAPLNMFTPSSEVKPDSANTLWLKLQEKELQLLTQFAPANGFEEMIMWTEQGKHWKLPIDNETEMGEEENIGFHEHVFLEKHLKGFPTKGPIRHFMDLVCVGLSKNPYISVERKIENIDWFRDYFKEKEDVLKDAGVLE